MSNKRVRSMLVAPVISAVVLFSATCKIIEPSEEGATVLLVSSATPRITTSQATILTAAGRTPDGSSVPVNVGWTASGGNVVRLSDTTAQFTSNATGDFTIAARVVDTPFAEASVGVEVIPAIAPTVSVLITPATVTLNVGAAQQFSVLATRQDGSTYTPAAVFTATGGNVSASGLYAAGALSGNFRVVAVLQGGTLSDTSVVTIAPAVLQTLTVTPQTVSLVPGEQQLFTAAGTWNNGATTAPSVFYSATGGSVTSAGRYTAGGTSGTFRAIARHSIGTLADTATITITAPTLQAVVLTPASVTLSPGSTQQFAVAGLWSDGSTNAPVVSYSVTGGNIGAAGLYTAGAIAGNFRVIATGGGKADTSTVVIAAVAPPPPPGADNMYFNSAESGCGTDANVLLCDDFEDGDWYIKNCNQALSSGGLLQTDGWCGTVYGPVTPAACNGQGFRSNCAASHGVASGQDGVTMADHDLSSPVKDLYIRFYLKMLPGYLIGQEKVLSINKDPAGVGGIYWGKLFFRCGAGETATSGMLQWSAVPPEDRCLNIINMTPGRWYYVEIRMNVQSSIFQAWADDCGTDGLACSGAPTQRLNTNIQYPSTTNNVASLWFENWANPGSFGTRIIDQIKVSRVGPIGFFVP